MSDKKTIKPFVDESRIGEHAAAQPVSGIQQMVTSTAVNGLGHGAFVRTTETSKNNKKTAA